MASSSSPPLTFYYSPSSTSDITTAILAELEHDAPQPLATRIAVDRRAGETRTQSYLTTVNPNGKVPAIVHDGVTVWESAAITLYLGEVFGEAKGLFPALGPARGEAMKWIVWSNFNLAPPMAKVMGFVWCPPDVGDAEKKVREETAAKGKEELAAGLRVLDGALTGKAYLVGGKYSLADTHVWCFVQFMTLLGVVDLSAFANVLEWNGKIKARPALAQTAASKPDEQ